MTAKRAVKPCKKSAKKVDPLFDSWSTVAVLKLAFIVLGVLPWVVFLVVGVRSLVRSTELRKEIPGGKSCVGWRETYFCHPFA